MEALGRYMLSQPQFKDRTFVSNPPGAALLIWSNNQFLPNVSGICLVERIANDVSEGISSMRLYGILKSQLFHTVPILNIHYNEDMSFLLINGEKMTLMEAAKVISETFSISIGGNAAKIPNNPSQIKDPFHIWTRETFDGHSVFKTDIDILTIRTEHGVEKVSAIIEVKRSNKIRVGKWLPYIDINKHNDINNYLIVMSFCNLLKAKFLTVHHEVMDENEEFSGNETVDCFWYYPGPNQNLLNTFGNENNRKALSVNTLLKLD